MSICSSTIAFNQNIKVVKKFTMKIYLENFNHLMAILRCKKSSFETQKINAYGKITHQMVKIKIV